MNIKKHLKIVPFVKKSLKKWYFNDGSRFIPISLTPIGYLFRKRPPICLTHDWCRSKKYRLIYFTIPKSACTTIISMLMDIENIDIKGENTQERVHKQKYLDQITVSPKVVQTLSLDNYFKFTFVRNPWDRLVSFYSSKIQENTEEFLTYLNALYPHVNFREMSFSQCVRFICKVPDGISEPHFRSQCGILGTAKPDFIGRFECFAEDMGTVIKRNQISEEYAKWIGIKQGASKHEHYTEYYDCKMRKMVEKRYAADIARFGYRFGK